MLPQRRKKWPWLWLLCVASYAAAAHATLPEPQYVRQREDAKNWLWYAPKSHEQPSLWQPEFQMSDARLPTVSVQMRRQEARTAPFGDVDAWPFELTGHLDVQNIGQQLQRRSPEKIKFYWRRLGLDALRGCDFVVSQASEGNLRLQSALVTTSATPGLLGLLGDPQPLAAYVVADKNDVALSVVPAKLMDFAMLWFSWFRPIESTLFWTQLLAFEDQAHFSIDGDALGRASQVWSVTWDKRDRNATQAVATLRVKNAKNTWKALRWLLHAVQQSGLPLHAQHVEICHKPSLRLRAASAPHASSYGWLAQTSEAIVVTQSLQALKAHLCGLPSSQTRPTIPAQSGAQIMVGHVLLEEKYWQKYLGAHFFMQTFAWKHKMPRLLSWTLTHEDTLWALDATAQQMPNVP